MLTKLCKPVAEAGTRIVDAGSNFSFLACDRSGRIVQLESETEELGVQGVTAA